jgi:predicted dehydrogenase
MDANRQEMGFLVVGAGFLGAQRAAAAVAARGARLAAILDRERDAAEAVARKHRVPVAPDLETGLRMPGVSAVVVATPPAGHAETVHEALDAGKHVLCEKPLAIDADEARALALHAEDAGLRLATGLNHRFYAPIRDAFRLVSTWSIGRIESLRVQIGHRASAAFLDGWHTDLSVSGGGTLMDNGPHACDLVRRFLGEVVVAQGCVRDSLELPTGCESEAYALFRNHDRAVAELRSSWTMEHGYLTLELRGSAGYLHVETAPWRLTGRLADGRPIAYHYVRERALESWYRWRHGCERSLVHEIEEFVAPDRGHARAHASGWDGVRVAEMVAAVYEAARAGSDVVLRPPQVHELHSSRRRVPKGVA